MAYLDLQENSNTDQKWRLEPLFVEKGNSLNQTHIGKSGSSNHRKWWIGWTITQKEEYSKFGTFVGFFKRILQFGVFLPLVEIGTWKGLEMGLDQGNWRFYLEKDRAISVILAYWRHNLGKLAFGAMTHVGNRKSGKFGTIFGRICNTGDVDQVM